MDVVLFTTEEPLYLPRYLEPIVEVHGDVIAAVVIVPPSTPTTVELCRQFRMFGLTDFIRMGARFAGSKLLDAAPAGVGRRLTGRYHAVRTLAAEHDIPVHRIGDVDDPDLLEILAGRNQDVLLSIVCCQKLPRSVLETAAVAINLHGSLLPKYRGRATAFWPLYHGDDATGVTAHLMTEQFDAGPIVEQRPFRLTEGDTFHSVSLKLAETGADLAVDLLAQFRTEGEGLRTAFDTRPNPTTEDEYVTLPTPAERRRFLRRGNAFI